MEIPRSFFPSIGKLIGEATLIAEGGVVAFGFAKVAFGFSLPDGAAVGAFFNKFGKADEALEHMVGNRVLHFAGEFVGVFVRNIEDVVEEAEQGAVFSCDLFCDPLAGGCQCDHIVGGVVHELFFGEMFQGSGNGGGFDV